VILGEGRKKNEAFCGRRGRVKIGRKIGVEFRAICGILCRDLKNYTRSVCVPGFFISVKKSAAA